MPLVLGVDPSATKSITGKNYNGAVDTTNSTGSFNESGNGTTSGNGNGSSNALILIMRRLSSDTMPTFIWGKGQSAPRSERGGAGLAQCDGLSEAGSNLGRVRSRRSLPKRALVPFVLLQTLCGDPHGSPGTDPPTRVLVGCRSHESMVFPSTGIDELEPLQIQCWRCEPRDGRF